MRLLSSASAAAFAGSPDGLLLLRLVVLFVALNGSSRLVVEKEVERGVERAARAVEVFLGPALQLEAPNDIVIALELRI